MPGRIVSIAGHERELLTDGWQLTCVPPGAVGGPDALAHAAATWFAAEVPGTVASALRAAGAWSLDGPERRFDAEDAWYRLRFAGSPASKGERVVLVFDGLATLADVWLDGEPLFSSESMFESHEVDVGARLGAVNELVLRFRSVDAELAKKRPRPKWRAPMVEHKDLRWIRTTLLGRTPGWTPPAAPVGPWRSIRIERRRGIELDALGVVARVERARGVVEVSVQLRSPSGEAVRSAALVLRRGDLEQRAALRPASAPDTWAGRLEVAEADLARWWPHTHGEPALYAASLEIDGVVADLGDVGFREATVHTERGGFGVEINGADVFCRGACWTPLDPVTLHADPVATAAAVDDARELGFNMLRVGGTMVYESDAFYDACDREGVLVFQDLMFANMDYPAADPAFGAAVVRETRGFLERLSARPSVAVVCGNSEVEQQAAMWGAPRAEWSPALFHETLEAVSRACCPQATYWPSSAHGGAFPHQNDAGTTSYYGVGAYLRPLEDARRSRVRFATECLAFSNVPEDGAIRAMPGGDSVRVHHALWKTRAPRDLGAGWDFEDVRDHYLRMLFGVDPVALRSRDHERYLALSRVVTGEVMAATFSEWRRGGSETSGALVWFLRDLWLGAGFGVLDARGAPKAAARYLRRTLQPTHLLLSDEGTNGVFAHVAHERPEPLAGVLEATLFRDEVTIARGSRDVALPGRGSLELPLAELFDGLYDTAYAYRFGPPSHDLVHASLAVDGQAPLEAFFFPVGRPADERDDVGLTAEIVQDGDAKVLVVRSRALAQSVHLEGRGVSPDDDYFHVAPGGERRVRLKTDDTARRCSVKALNGRRTVTVELGS